MPGSFSINRHYDIDHSTILDSKKVIASASHEKAYQSQGSGLYQHNRQQGQRDREPSRRRHARDLERD